LRIASAHALVKQGDYLMLKLPRMEKKAKEGYGLLGLKTGWKGADPDKFGKDFALRCNRLL